jgi:hypothetical protein
MQDTYKSLKKELKKSDDKYDLTEKECTAKLILDGKIFVTTAIRKSVIGWYHEYLCHLGGTHRINNLRNYDVVRIS